MKFVGYLTAFCPAIFLGISAPALGESMRGRVLSIDPIILRKSESLFNSENLILKNYFAQIDSDGIYLSPANSESEKTECPSYTRINSDLKSLGFLDSPVSLQVETEKTPFFVTLSAANEVFSNAEKCKFKIDLTKYGFAADYDGTTNERDRVLHRHYENKITNSDLLVKLAQEIEDKNYQEARGVYSQLLQQKLYSEELVDLDGLFQSIPKIERPIEVYKDDRYVNLKNLKEYFGGLSFFEMTQTQFINFIEKWSGPEGEKAAEHKEGARLLLTFLFKKLIPEERQVDFLIGLVKVRLEKMMDEGGEGFYMLASDKAKVVKALELLRQIKDRSAKDYLQSLKSKSKNLESSRPEHLVFLRKVFGDLSVLQDSSMAHSTITVNK